MLRMGAKIQSQTLCGRQSILETSIVFLLLHTRKREVKVVEVSGEGRYQLNMATLHLVHKNTRGQIPCSAIPHPTNIQRQFDSQGI